MLEATETKIDSADLYSDTSEFSILIVGSPALALGLQLSIYAEAATAEQPTVSKTVSGQGLAVRVAGCLGNFSGLWRGRCKLGFAPTTSSNRNRIGHAAKRKCVAGENSATDCRGDGSQQHLGDLEREWHPRRKRNFRNHLSGRNVYRPHGLAGSCTCENCGHSRKQGLILQLPALTAEIGESHPPPNSNPGPSDATNIGRRGRITTALEASSAKCKAAAQVVEPKFPRVSATMGNRSSATPDFLASSATSRGLG